MEAIYNEANEYSASSRVNYASGRDYMMRSEKRSRGSGSAPSGSPRNKKRPPKRRRRRAGSFYIMLMILLLLVLWPVGLFMLWQRKVRWGIGTKLLTSVVTLGACIILIGFALTVSTGNAEYTAFQDKANSYLDVAADALIEASDVVVEKSAVVYEGASNLADAIWTSGRNYLADGLVYGAEFGQQAKAKIEELIDSIGVEGEIAESTEEPAADQSTPAPEEGEAVEESASPEPEVEVTLDPEGDSLPVYIPGASTNAGEGSAISQDAILTREGVLSEATLQPTPTPQPTPEPTPEILDFEVQPAGEAIVYYNLSGKCYHMGPVCGSMKSADAHSFSDTLEVAVRYCSICGTPDKSILDEKYIVWTDGENTAHLSSNCAEFTGGWNIITATQANEDGVAACSACQADLYLKAIAAGKDVSVHTPAVTPEPTAEPTPEPTEAPTPVPTQEPTEVPTAVPTAEVEIVALNIEEEPSEEVPAAEEAVATEEPVISLEPVVTEEPDAEVPAQEATPVPTAVPAATPTPMMITPTRALKEAGAAIVYLEGETIHLLANCGASAVQTTLAECAGKIACENCAAPLAEYAEENCLWQDADGLCHTSDECEAFAGQFKLILRDEALEDGFSGCKECKAAEYLFPRTSINYDGIKK